jgi:glycosyltransferase involved in cell wall biosynthesis
MRILQWAFPFLPHQGGREVMVDTLSRELQKLGHQVLVATNTLGSDLLTLPYGLVRIDPVSPDEAIQAIRDFEPDIIHLHNYLHNSVVLLSALGLKAKVVWTLHDEHKTSQETAAVARFKWVRENVSCIVAISDFVKDSIDQAKDFVGVPVQMIWNGTKNVTRSEPLGENILFMGRIELEKGLGYLLASMFLLVQKHPDAQLRVAGDGAFKGTFEKLATDLGIGGNVSFLGWQTGEELASAIASSRMIVVPSAWKEPFGLVAIEAMMNGRPVIVTDRGGLPELIEPGISGYVVQPGEVLELATRMSQLLEDDELAQKMGQAGFSRANENFSMQAAALNYVKVYEAWT